jgi:hypothetical protein
MDCYNIAIIIMIIALCSLFVLFPLKHDQNMFEYFTDDTNDTNNVNDTNIIGYYDKDEKHMYTPDEIFAHMSYIDDKLKKFNIKHWIMYGTLLGAVRQNDIIPYDYDFDFGAHIEDMDKILLLNDVVKDDGYEFTKPMSNCYAYNYPNNRKVCWRVSLKVTYDGIVMGDIYLYKLCDDNFMRRYSDIDKIYFYPTSTFHRVFIDELECVTIRNKCFDAPIMPHLLLEHWYGKTWQTPIRAVAQGGKSRADNNEYGESKTISLNNMINSLNEHGYSVNYPAFDKDISYVYPFDGIDWIHKNEEI